MFKNMKNTERLEKLKKEILETLKKSPIETDSMHAQIVYKWVLNLKSDADEALQIAALSHDIERAVTSITEKDLKEYSKIDEFKKEHALRSAEIISNMLRRYDYSEIMISKVRKLVENHEVGGDEETNILRNADSIAYFEYNIPVYLRRNGREQTKNKIQFMYKRIPVEVQSVINQIDFSDKEIRDLIKEAILFLTKEIGLAEPR
jgi:hypothetical protein